MELQKLLFIVNPRAGRNKPHGPLFDALSVLSQAGYLIRIRQTAAPGDAAEIAGISKRVGTLTPGKDADVVVTTGHPLDWRSQVLAVFLEGTPVAGKNFV